MSGSSSTIRMLLPSSDVVTAVISSMVRARRDVAAFARQGSLGRLRTPIKSGYRRRHSRTHLSSAAYRPWAAPAGQQSEVEDPGGVCDPVSRGVRSAAYEARPPRGGCAARITPLGTSDGHTGAGLGTRERPTATSRFRDSVGVSWPRSPGPSRSGFHVSAAHAELSTSERDAVASDRVQPSEQRGLRDTAYAVKQPEWIMGSRGFEDLGIWRGGCLGSLVSLLPPLRSRRIIRATNLNDPQKAARRLRGHGRRETSAGFPAAAALMLGHGFALRTC